MHNGALKISNLPAWFHIEPTGSHVDPYMVSLTVEGTVVGSIDVFKVQRDSGGSLTSDRITPACPQGTLDYVLPESGGPGSPSHINQLRRLTLEFHRLVVPLSIDDSGPGTPSPELKRNVTIELPRTEEWVVVFDARAGTNQLDGSGEPFPSRTKVSYSMWVDGGSFISNAFSPPDRPLDPTIWVGNAGQCLPP